MRSILFTTTLLAGFAATAAHAVDVKLYGQVNKSLIGFDDGENTDFGIYDNDQSSTRFGFKGEQLLDNGLTATVLYEAEMQSNPSNEFIQNTTGGNSSTPVSNTPSLDERHASVGLSGNFGGVVLGQTTTAIDYALKQDLVGVKDMMSADFHKIGGGLNLRTAAGGLSGATIQSTTPNAGTKRRDAIRYDSPKLETTVGKFQGKISAAQGGDIDTALFYEGEVGKFKLKGAAGVEFNNDLSTTPTTVNYDQRYIASGSVLHKSGISGGLAYTTDTLRSGAAGSDPEQWYAKVGYAWDAYELAADYGQANHYGNAVLAENKLESVGVGAQYNMGNGVSLAGLYRNFEGERTGASLQDIDLVAANLRVKF